MFDYLAAAAAATAAEEHVHRYSQYKTVYVFFLLIFIQPSIFMQEKDNVTLFDGHVNMN